MLLSQYDSRHFNKNSWYKDKATQINGIILFEESKRSAFSNKHKTTPSIRIPGRDSLQFVAVSIVYPRVCFGIPPSCRLHSRNLSVYISWLIKYLPLYVTQQLGLHISRISTIRCYIGRKKWLHERRKKQKRMQTTTLYLFCVCFSDETRNRLSYANVRPTYQQFANDVTPAMLEKWGNGITQACNKFKRLWLNRRCIFFWHLMSSSSFINLWELLSKPVVMLFLPKHPILYKYDLLLLLANSNSLK